MRRHTTRSPMLTATLTAISSISYIIRSIILLALPPADDTLKETSPAKHEENAPHLLPRRFPRVFLPLALPIAQQCEGWPGVCLFVGSKHIHILLFARTRCNTDLLLVISSAFFI